MFNFAVDLKFTNPMQKHIKILRKCANCILMPCPTFVITTLSADNFFYLKYHFEKTAMATSSKLIFVAKANLKK